MTWFRVDDGFWRDEKVMAARLPMDARGLMMTAGSWCGDQLSDGKFPKSMLKIVGGTIKQARRLIDAGLWIDDGDAYIFVKWTKYNPTKAQVVQERDSKTERQRRWRQSSTGNNGKCTVGALVDRLQDSNETHNETHNETLPRPDPTRPSKSTAVDLKIHQVTARTHNPASATAAKIPEKIDLSSPKTALLTAIGQRSRALLEARHLGEWCAPHEWPEVLAAFEIFRRAVSKPELKLSFWPSDRGLEAIVIWFASGFELVELAELIPKIIDGEWWTQKRRGLSSITAEVLRRAQGDAEPDLSTEAREVLEAAKRALRREETRP